MSEFPPPPPQPGGYGQPMPYSAPPNNNLVWAILSTVLCCLPLGVVSIVKAAEVNNKWAMGDYAGAHASAAAAKKWAIWSAVAAVAFSVLYVIFIIVVGVAGSSSSSSSY